MSLTCSLKDASADKVFCLNNRPHTVHVQLKGKHK